MSAETLPEVDPVRAASEDLRALACITTDIYVPRCAVLSHPLATPFMFSFLTGPATFCIPMYPNHVLCSANVTYVAYLCP